MVEENIESKSRNWFVIPPIRISGENLSISLAPNGEITAPYSGTIVIKAIDSEKGQIICELMPNERITRKEQADLSVIVSGSHSKLIPHGYSYFFTEQAKSRAYGREFSNYVYYKKERDLSYLVIIKKNRHPKRIYLGSLQDPNSIISEALRVFPKIEFLRKDIKYKEMPSGLRHGQKLKATLDILTKEGFFIRAETRYGNKTIEKFTRTEKTTSQLKS